jgi:cysteine desulfurase
LIVGLGKAAELAANEHLVRNAMAQSVKRRLIDGLQQIELKIHGNQSRCLPRVLNVSFPGVDSEALMMAVRNDLAFSNGSACTSTI